MVVRKLHEAVHAPKMVYLWGGRTSSSELEDISHDHRMLLSEVTNSSTEPGKYKFAGQMKAEDVCNICDSARD